LKAQIRNHRLAAGCTPCPALPCKREVSLDTALGAPLGQLQSGPTGRPGCGLPSPPRARPPHLSLGAELPRQTFTASSRWASSASSPSAPVGSLQRGAPAHRISSIPDQYFDRTRLRPSTFFGDGLVVHISFCRPGLSPDGRGRPSRLPGGRGARHPRRNLHLHGSPQFSTKAESNPLSQLGPWTSSA